MSAENKINQIYIIRNSSEIRNINVKINIPSNFTYNKKKKNIRNFHLLMPQNLPPDLIFLQPAVPWQFFRVTLINYSFPSLPPRVIYHLFTFESEPLYILNLMGIKMSPLSRVYPFNRRSERSLSLSLSLPLSLPGTWRKVFYAVPRGEEGRGRINQTAPRDKTAFRFASWN